MPKSFGYIALLLLSAAAAMSAAPPLSEPAVSPDGKEIAFSSAGEIWTVPIAGGAARLLISGPGTDGHPVYSPDGNTIAFESTRDGARNIYLYNAGTSSVQRLTWSDLAETVDGFSADGKWVYFNSGSDEISGTTDIFRVAVSGGTPMPVQSDTYISEYQASPSPDGKSLLFVVRGFGQSQWWRRGRSHIDENEIWLAKEGAAPQKLLGRGAKQLWPRWSPDGSSFVYVTDRGGPQNIARYPLTSGKAEQLLTSFTDGRALFLSASRDGKTLVFERDFQIWKLVGKAKPEPLSIQLRGSAPAEDRKRLTLSNGFSDLAVSPDGKKVAFVARGEVWAAGMTEAGDAFRVTSTPAEEVLSGWSSDSTQLLYLSFRSGQPVPYLYDFKKRTETALVDAPRSISGALFSPNGKRVALLEDGMKLKVLDLDTKKETEVATARMARPGTVTGAFAWSPDSEWLTFMAQGNKGFRNAWVVSATGASPAQQISFLPNSFGGAPHWSADGKAIFFSTQQRTEDARIARIHLNPITPEFREKKFDELFETPKKPEAKGDAPKPVTMSLAGVRSRLQLLELGTGAFDPVVSPDGKQLAFVCQVVQQPSICTYSLDPLAKEPPATKSLVTSPSNKGDLQWSADSKSLHYLDGGKVQTLTVETKAVKPIALSVELEDQFSTTKRAVFEQAWRIMRDNFYDPAYHGVNWTKVRETYAPVVDAVQTSPDLRRVLSLMVGELDASHLGVMGSDGGPGAPPSPSVGRLGIDWDPAAYQSRGELLVHSVLADGPSASAGIKTGDVLLSVNGKPLQAEQNLWATLANTVGKQLKLGFRRGSENLTFELRPIRNNAEKGLRYLAWVQSRRNYVTKQSGGKLGYVHMPDMSDSSLDKLALDLDEENHGKQGVVVDVRDNNGGFVNMYAIDILSRRNYLNFTSRGFDTVPARSSLGQRALDRPVVLVTNQMTLSDGEDFSEGFRTLKLGKVVGEPTAGWIIYTGGQGLLDGSFLRVPQIRVSTVSGENMERNPRPVDVRVDRMIGESAQQVDSQLDVAVKTLLADLPK